MKKQKTIDQETYEKWVKSRGFRALRELVLERDNHTCQFCHRTLEEIQDSNKKITLQAHHSRYLNVGKGNEEELNDIITCCSVCHRSMHSARSNMSRFVDKHWIMDNIKENPDMRCRVENKKDSEV